MKKYFVLVLFALLGTFSNVQAQNSELPKGVKIGLNGKIHLCLYEEAYFLVHPLVMDYKLKIKQLEIAYNGIDDSYGIHITYHNDQINKLSVKFSRRLLGSYLYEGNNITTKEKVEIQTKTDLSAYTNNLGTDSSHDFLISFSSPKDGNYTYSLFIERNE